MKNSDELSNPSTPDLANQPEYRPLIIAGLVLGLGQGGFFDGIIFHQLLQWHHMFSSLTTDMTVAGMEINTLGDGLFHLADWLFTLAGIFLLWRAGTRAKVAHSGQAFSGALLMGAGLFNLVEGVIDHHILGIHHLKPGPHQLLWDLGFLGSGVLLLVIGWILIQSARKAS
ncbi:DUF2243 domain-containing protein [Laspinema olomoucense]|uniref:DUF2243 domain-containing protein n=1 Tax=Laspinema olomoucense TaxID=3231600 RepID=UPI0021BB4238|nr:DUF2243 domain-containing protein [Laspinema sp. D3a]MCT7990943.1 DUF2243 domain-containing protein [Laspinema sp. D3a]